MLKKILKVGLLPVMLFFIGIFTVDRVVVRSASGSIYGSVSRIPHHKVGLLPGTSKHLPGGRINLYYQYRIDAAVHLFNSGKIDYILVSGDNSTKHYDEPSTIRKDLMKRGIPAHRIVLDYAGFRTLDSVIRSKEVFGQDGITIISQRFHNERAIYIAKRKHIEAVGFNAKDVDVYYGFKTRLREKLARVKMMIDLLVGKKPKFLGEKIKIGK